ncbi:LAO/AO transport system kinase [Striga asiatica]|uniref:LAO/AO transport system kinase n=1 Tax=Striga asiatica TaxID=4170 RepID=A0A5A7QQA9_STRAF|nr:LAO/AO transport system kinase [Striga asiatica]
MRRKIINVLNFFLYFLLINFHDFLKGIQMGPVRMTCQLSAVAADGPGSGNSWTKEAQIQLGLCHMNLRTMHPPTILHCGAILRVAERVGYKAMLVNHIASLAHCPFPNNIVSPKHLMRIMAGKMLLNVKCENTRILGCA